MLSNVRRQSHKIFLHFHFAVGASTLHIQYGNDIEKSLLICIKSIFLFEKFAVVIRSVVSMILHFDGQYYLISFRIGMDNPYFHPFGTERFQMIRHSIGIPKYGAIIMKSTVEQNHNGQWTLL